MRHLILAAAASSLAILPSVAQDAEAPEASAEATGTAYDLDLNHASLIWRVSHGGGLSMYTARFTDFDANLVFDPESPEAASLSVTVDPTSVFTGYTADDTFRESHPNAVADTWDGELAKGWFQADEHPEITFEATGINVSGENTGTVTGDLTFLSVTQPVTLDVTFNGTQEFPWNEGRKSIGFSATGELTRSEFGLDRMVGPLGDTVELVIEAEFLEAAE